MVLLPSLLCSKPPQSPLDFNNCKQVLPLNSNPTLRESPKKGARNKKAVLRARNEFPCLRQARYDPGSEARLMKFPSDPDEIRRAMEAINEKYRPVHGPPPFVMDFLNLVDTDDTRGLVNTFVCYPHLFRFEDISPFFVYTGPHIDYNNEHLFSDDSVQMAKSVDGGVSFLTWVVHKDYLRGSPFEALMGRGLSPEEISDEALKNPGLPSVSQAGTLPTLRDRASQRKGTNHRPPQNRKRDVKHPSYAQVDDTMKKEVHGRSLTNPFDLQPLGIHSYLLQKIAEHGQLLCKQNCGFDPEEGDVLNQYMHLFYLLPTVTLHAHHRLNQGISEGERKKCIFLDEARDCLSKNQDLSAWIADKQERGEFITRDAPFHEMLEDGSLEDFMEIQKTIF